MPQNHRWLAALALVAVVGCQQSSTQSSGAMSGDGTSTTNATTKPGASTAAGSTSTGAATTPGSSATAAQEVTLPDGLIIQDLKVGDGAVAEDGLTVAMHYTGWLTDGTKFDSSLDRGQPYPFRLGTGSVVKGWDEGIKGMRVGGKRKLTIPPDLGYGARGYPPVIPPNATLVFEVELMSVR